MFIHLSIYRHLVCFPLFLATPCGRWDPSSPTRDQTHAPPAVEAQFFVFVFVFMAVLGLCFCARAFSSCGKCGPPSSRCTGLSLSWPLLLRSTSSRRAGSVVVAHGPSCSAACGIFPDQGSNPCPLHWQVDSQPLRHQGSPEAQFQPLGPPGL